jgi:hypothetical protein
MKRFAFLTIIALVLSVTASAQRQPGQANTDDSTIYTSLQLGFEIVFPSTVKAFDAKPDKAFNGHPFTNNTFLSQNTNGVYVVMVATFSDERPGDAPEAAINSVLASTIKNGAPGQTLVDVTRCSPKVTTPCKLAFIDVPAGSDHNAMRIVELITVKNNRVYEVMFGGDVTPQPNFDEVTAFFDSLKIL